MIRSVQAELVKLTRPRFVAITIVVTIVVAAALTAVGVLTAESRPAGGPPRPELCSPSSRSVTPAAARRCWPKPPASRRYSCWPCSSPRLPAS